MTPSTEEPKQYLAFANQTNDGWSTENEATATCFCGEVQLSFPTVAPGLVSVFICNCTDCHKLTASVFATNFTIRDTHLTHVRGQSNLKTYGQSKTIASGKKMTNYFCSTCGTLMYRVGESFPGMSILRVGTVDDFTLHETKLFPHYEQFNTDRVSWKAPTEGVAQFDRSKATKELEAWPVRPGHSSSSHL